VSFVPLALQADPGLVQLEFAMPLAEDGISRDPAVLERPEVGGRLRERAAAEGGEELPAC
jgi:hypothetical protein